MIPDPTDPGFVLFQEQMRRMVRGILRTETLPHNYIPQPVEARHSIEKFRLIRGQSTTTQSGPVITINNVVDLSGGKDPTGGNLAGVVRVANKIFPRIYTTGQWVDAISSPNAIAIDDPDASGEQVDWETLETGSGGSGTSFRWFELGTAKPTTTSPISVYWLDENQNPLAGTDAVYDPEHLFSGKPTGYLVTDMGTASGTGFHGIAELRSDLATGTYTQSARWEMIAMEGYAETVILHYSGLTWVLDSFYGGQWQRKQPAIINYQITITDPLSLTASPTSGDKIVCVLSNPDTTPPTYEVIGKQPKDRFVAADPTDTGPKTLIEKLYNNSTYNALVHELVGFDAMTDGGERKVRGFFTPSSSGSSGSGTTGTINSITSLSFTLDPAHLVIKIGYGAYLVPNIQFLGNGIFTGTVDVTDCG